MEGSKQKDTFAELTGFTLEAKDAEILESLWKQFQQRLKILRAADVLDEEVAGVFDPKTDRPAGS